MSTAAASANLQNSIVEVRAYIMAHNRHDLPAIMAFYAEGATFVLNGGRPPVQGRAKIADLERFDVAAGSNVRVEGLQARADGEDVVVSLRQVLEHSRVFAAAGVDTVFTEPLPRAFVIRDGKFVLVAQPEFKAACREAVFPALWGTVAWLKSSGDARATVLAPNGALQLTARNVAVLVSAIRDWRTVSGWGPEDGKVRLCASLP